MLINNNSKKRILKLFLEYLCRNINTQKPTFITKMRSAPPNYNFQPSCLLILPHAWTRALMSNILRMWNWNLRVNLHLEDFFLGLLLWLPFELEAHFPHGSFCLVLHSQMNKPLYQAFSVFDSRSTHTTFPNHYYQQKPLKESPDFWHTQMWGQSVDPRLQISKV